MTINPSKSNVTLFGSKLNRSNCLDNLQIFANGEKLNFVHCARNLGLYLDYSLRFTEHINYCIKKAYSNLKFIYSIHKILDKKSKIMLCNSLVLSHFDFADVVYNFCITKVEEKRIQKIQNSCVRLIFGLRKYDSVSLKIKEISWLNMRERRVLHSCCLYQRVIYSGIPIYLYKKIEFCGDIHQLNTRNRKLILPPKHSTTLYKRSFSYNIFKYYNMIPNEVKILQKNERFKSKLRKMIFSQEFSTT